MAGFNARIAEFGEANPMRSGPAADLLALIPFAVLITILYLTGREKLLAPRPAKTQ